MDDADLSQRQVFVHRERLKTIPRSGQLAMFKIEKARLYTSMVLCSLKWKLEIYFQAALSLSNR